MLKRVVLGLTAAIGLSLAAGTAVLAIDGVPPAGEIGSIYVYSEDDAAYVLQLDVHAADFSTDYPGSGSWPVAPRISGGMSIHASATMDVRLLRASDCVLVASYRLPAGVNFHVLTISAGGAVRLSRSDVTDTDLLAAAQTDRCGQPDSSTADVVTRTSASELFPTFALLGLLFALSAVAIDKRRASSW